MGRRGRVLRKAVKAALMQLRIGDGAALFAHSCLPKAPIGFEEPIVTLALNDILSRSVAARCRVSRQGKERSQADSQENLARSSFEPHNERLHTLDLPVTFEKALSSEDIMPHTSTLVALQHNNLRSGRGTGSSSRTWNTPPVVSVFDPTHHRATKALARVASAK
jgi:hypothetical protein